jgi:hypothetical protein
MNSTKTQYGSLQETDANSIHLEGRANSLPSSTRDTWASSNSYELAWSQQNLLPKQIHYFNQRRIDIIAAAVDFPTQSGWLQSNFNLPIGSIPILVYIT